MHNTQDALETLAENECPHNHNGRCELTGKTCHIADALSDAEFLSDLDCPEFTEKYLPPEWSLRDLLNYAEWYSA